MSTERENAEAAADVFAAAFLKVLKDRLVLHAVLNTYPNDASELSVGLFYKDPDNYDIPVQIATSSVVFSLDVRPSVARIVPR